MTSADSMLTADRAAPAVLPAAVAAWDTNGAALPHPLDCLIGREHDVAALKALLVRPEARLITLTGPGGVGKTRLAIAAAAQVRPDVDGVAFVALASLRAPALLLPEIERALAPLTASATLPADPDPDATTAALAVIAARLAGQRWLIVLDNVEQLLPAAPQLAALLQAAPALKLLVTSRAVLRLAGERLVPVAPLAVPPAAATPAAVLAAPAGQLFVARAEAVDPSFALTPATAPAVAAICQQLDGLPLAIELAAARLRHLSLPALQRRLAARLPDLIDGPRDHPDRLQTMRAAIAWSDDLLPPAAQTLFRQLGVFVGGSSLPAITAVHAAALAASLGASPDPAPGGEHAALAGPDAAAVFAAVATLVDHSLLRRVPDGDEPRYAMLETVREFALSTLVGPAGATVHAAHAAFFTALATELQPALIGTTPGPALARLTADHDNLRAALRWALANDAINLAARLAAALWRFWQVRGHWSEGRDWLAQVLAATAATPLPAGVRAELCLGAGALAVPQGDNATAMHWLNQAAASFDDLADWQRQGDVLSNLGLAASARVDHVAAVAAHQAALNAYRRGKVTTGIADATHNLGNVAYEQGETDRAVRLWEESLAIERQLGRRHGVAGSVFNLGVIAYFTGDLPRASALKREALAVYAELGQQDSVAWTLEGLARVAGTVWPERAARLLGLAEVQIAAVGARVPDHQQEAHHLLVAQLRTQLGDGGLAAAWATGRAMTLDEAQTIAAEVERRLLAPGRTTPPGPASSTVAGSALKPAGHGLTVREQEVLVFLAAGETNQAIADRLFISRPTVARHIANIYGKFDVDSRGKATAYAHEHGILP